jgi:hypothetical protein
MNQFYLPMPAASAARDPYPMDDRICRYDVFRRARAFDGKTREINLISFDYQEQAVAFVGNCEQHFGPDLWIEEVDTRSGNSECILAGEWDEDLNRYLNQ